MSLPANGPTGHTQPKAIIGVSLKMYFGYERTLDWCRDVAAIAADHPAVRGGEIELFALPPTRFSPKRHGSSAPPG